MILVKSQNAFPSQTALQYGIEFYHKIEVGGPLNAYNASKWTSRPRHPIYFIKRKDEVFGAFQKFVALVENQTCKKLNCLRFDNGGEYVSKIFHEFCDKQGIKRDLTTPHNPSQNGAAERTNQTIQDRPL